jgi:hypothetical protein
LPACDSPVKFASATLFINWQFGTQLATAQTALAASFLLHRAKIGKGATNKSGNSPQWRSELFSYQDGIFIN